MKKIFIIALILLILVTATLIIYNLFFKGPGVSSPTPLPGVLPEASPGAGEAIETPSAGKVPSPGQKIGALRAISQEKVMAPTIGTDGKTVKYFARATGQIWQSNFDGTSLQKISSTALKNVVKILWSPDKEKVIGIFSENDQLKKYFFNYTNNQTAPLNQNIGYIAWSPDSKSIAYEYTDPATGQSNISLANPDGTNWRNIFKTRIEQLVVEWPVKEKISIRTPTSGLAQGLLYAIDSSTGDFYRILSDVFGLNSKWSAKADKILISFTDAFGKNPKIALTDEKGEKTKDLNLAGIVDKCTWSKNGYTIFCSLPLKISENDIWPDDYYKGLMILNDAIYKINLETDEKTKIAGSLDQVGLDIQELFLSPKEDYLFFVNKKDGLLYSLRLQ